jgi:glycogen debranching enzyme
MIKFSASLKELSLPTEVKSAADVDTLMNAFKEYTKQFEFWQYYTFDIKAEKEGVKVALDAGKAIAWDGPTVQDWSSADVASLLRSHKNGELVLGLGKYAKRFGVHFDPAIAAGVLRSMRPQGDAASLAHVWGQVIDVLNVPLYQEWEEDMRMAFDNIRGRLRFGRLDDHGPKLGPITKEWVFSVSLSCLM